MDMRGTRGTKTTATRTHQQMAGTTVGCMVSYATKSTQAQLAETKRKATRTMEPWRTRWAAKISSGTTPELAHEMKGQTIKSLIM